MHATKPIRFTPATLTTSVADTSAAAYNAATTYAKGALVSAVDITGKTDWTHEYESNADDNVGHALSDGVWWLDTGPTNRHRLLDASTSTETVATTSLQLSLIPGQYWDTLALIRLRNVTSISILVERGAETIYSETVTLEETSIGSWADYFFSPLGDWATKLEWRNSVWFNDSEITVTLAGPTGEEIGCGLLMVGLSDEFGITLDGANVGIEDYSTKETNKTFGGTFLLEREYADTADCQIIIDTEQVGYLRRKLAALRATPALYNLNNPNLSARQDDSLILFAKYDSFSINIDNGTKSYCNLNLLELI